MFVGVQFFVFFACVKYVSSGYASREPLLERTEGVTANEEQCRTTESRRSLVSTLPHCFLRNRTNDYSPASRAKTPNLRRRFHVCVFNVSEVDVEGFLVLCFSKRNRLIKKG